MTSTIPTPWLSTLGVIFVSVAPSGCGSLDHTADLARNERAYVDAYLRRLAAKGHSLSYEDAWREYRLHALWALTALVISAGASKEYFAEGPARLTISRAAAAVERVDARGALLDLID